ncbi:hypothetical protein LguiB_002197 [Lonicera macranthoides]
MSDYIPPELILHILSWLPPKSLLRFRCVSKSWCSLISSPNFITMHTRKLKLTNPNATTRTLVRHYSKTLKKELYSVHFDNESFDLDNDVKIEFPFRSQARYYFRIVGCSNGLICLSDDLFGYTNIIILWNPAIRRKLTLPLPHGMLENLGASMVVLGFGFDANTDDYKVVRIAYIQGDAALAVPPEVEVYAVKEGQWRGISAPLPQYRIADFFWSQAFVNGASHWVAYCMSETCINFAYYTSGGCASKFQCLIMLFDMGDEVFKEMMLPESLVCKTPMNMYTSVIRDSLSVILYDNKFCSIWVMKEYGVIESWGKQFSICLEGGLGMMIGVKKNGEVLVAEGTGELVAHNPGTGQILNVGMAGTRNSFYADAYKESLGLLVEGKRIRGRQANDSESDSSGDDNESGDDVEKNEQLVRRITVQYLTALFNDR